MAQQASEQPTGIILSKEALWADRTFDLPFLDCAVQEA
jgi:hypothetical protein